MNQDKTKKASYLFKIPLQKILENILFSISNSSPPILCLTHSNEAFVPIGHEIAPVQLNKKAIRSICRSQG